MAERDDVPFDSDFPFDSLDREREEATAIIERELPGYRLLYQPRSDRADTREVADRAPSLAEIQEFYQRSPRRVWPERRAERYRLYRIYPVELENTPNETPVVRHVTIVYRRTRNDEVIGQIHSYEA